MSVVASQSVSVNCPSCGAELQPDNRFAHLVICAHCQSSVIVDEKAARLAGKMALLASTPSPLYVGGTGQLGKRHFTVVGRVRYGYEQGYWDEWCIAFRNGETAWISEDGDELTFEKWGEMAHDPLNYATTNPGDRVQLGKYELHVDEKGIAICEGAEGQLPFEVIQGEKTPYLDLSQGDVFATIEFDLNDDTRIYRGRRLDPAEITMDLTAHEAGATYQLKTERPEEGALRERVVRQSGRAAGLNCYACGGPLEIPEDPPETITCGYCSATTDLSLKPVTCPACAANVPVHGGSDARSLVCPSCHTQLDLRRGEPSVLQSLAEVKRPRVPLKLGQRATFDGVTYELVGHLRLVEWDDEGRYWTSEFLLHNQEQGYRWLTMYNNHFSLGRKIHDLPKTIDPRRAIRKQSFNHDGRTWKVFETNHGRMEVRYVEGEFPWVAQIGDHSSYMDAICPPYMLSAEWTGSEMEWFESKYVTRRELAEAFDMEESKLPHPIGVGACQPYPAGPFRRQSAWVMAIFAVIFLGLTFWGFGRGGKEVGRFQVSPSDYAAEYLTPPFPIMQSGAVCEAEFSAPVDNSWVYMDVAVVNEKEEAVLDFSAEMSYYHGYEGGESWSEGSRSDSVVFKLDEPGTYRFLVLGQAGTGETAGSLLTAGRPVTITVESGVIPVRYFLALALVCGCWASLEWIRRGTFHSSRWGESEEDDD